MATETNILESVSSKILEAVKEKNTTELEKITEQVTEPPSIMPPDATLTEEKGGREDNVLSSEHLEEKVFPELSCDKMKQLESRPNPPLETSSHETETVNTQLEADVKIGKEIVAAIGDIGTVGGETFFQTLSVPVAITDEKNIPESCEAATTENLAERNTTEIESVTEGSNVNVLGLTKGSDKDIEEVTKISDKDETRRDFSNTETEDAKKEEELKQRQVETTTELEKITKQDFQESQTEANKDIEAKIGAENQADREEPENQNLPVKDGESVSVIQIPAVPTPEVSSMKEEQGQHENDGSVTKEIACDKKDEKDDSVLLSELLEEKVTDLPCDEVKQLESRPNPPIETSSHVVETVNTKLESDIKIGKENVAAGDDAGTDEGETFFQALSVPMVTTDGNHDMPESCEATTEETASVKEGKPNGELVEIVASKEASGNERQPSNGDHTKGSQIEVEGGSKVSKEAEEVLSAQVEGSIVNVLDLTKGFNKDKEEVTEINQNDENSNTEKAAPYEEDLLGKNHASEGKKPEFITTRESVVEDTEKISPGVETEEKTEQQGQHAVTTDVSISTQTGSQNEITRNEEVAEGDDGQKEKSDSPSVKEVCEETRSEKVESKEGVEISDNSSMQLNEKAIETLIGDKNMSEEGKGENDITGSEDAGYERELQGKNHYGKDKEPEFVKSIESIDEDNEDVRSSVEIKEKVEQQELLDDITHDVSITRQTESHEETTENEEKKEDAALQSDNGQKEESDSHSVKELCEETGPEKPESEESIELSRISNIILKESTIETLSKGEGEEKEQELNMSETGQGEDEVACSQSQDAASEEELQGQRHNSEGKEPEVVKTTKSIYDDTEENRSVETKQKMEHQGSLHAVPDVSISTQTDSQEEITQNKENVEETIGSDDGRKEKSDSPDVSEETGSEKTECEKGEFSDSSDIKLNDKAIESLSRDEEQENDQAINMSEKSEAEDDIAHSQPQDAVSEEELQGGNDDGEGKEPEMVKIKESIDEDTEDIRSLETKETVEEERLLHAITTDVSITTQTESREETTQNKEENVEERIMSDDGQKEKSDSLSVKEVCEKTCPEKAESEETGKLSDISNLTLNEKETDILSKGEDQEKEQELNMTKKGQGEDDAACSQPQGTASEEELQGKNHNSEVKEPENVNTREGTEEIKSAETKEKVEQEELVRTNTDVSFSTETVSLEESTESVEKNAEDAAENDDGGKEKPDIPLVKEVSPGIGSEKAEIEDGVDVELSDGSGIKQNEKAIESLSKAEDQDKEQELTMSEKDQCEAEVTYSQDVVSEKELQEKNHNSEGKEPGLIKTRESVEEDTEEIRSSVETKENAEQEGLLHSTMTDVSISTQAQSQQEPIENENKNVEEAIESDDCQMEKTDSLVKEVSEKTGSEKAENKESVELPDSSSIKLIKKAMDNLSKNEDQEKEQELNMSEEGQDEYDVTCSQEVATEDELLGKSHNNEVKEPEFVKTREGTEEDTDKIKSVEAKENVEQEGLLHAINTDAPRTESQEETTENEKLNEEATKSDDGQKEESGSPSVKEVYEETGLEKVEAEEGAKLSDSFTSSTMVNENEITPLSKDDDQEKEQDLNVSKKDQGGDDVTTSQNAPCEDIKETTISQHATTEIYFEEQGLIGRPKEILKDETEKKSVDAQEASEQHENAAENKTEEKPEESANVTVRSSSEMKQEVERKSTQDEVDAENKNEEEKTSGTQFVDKDFDVTYPVEETEAGHTKDELKPKDTDLQVDKGSSEGSDVLLSRSIKTEAIQGSETGELETKVEQELQENTGGHKSEGSESEGPSTITQEIVEAVGENAMELEKIMEQDFQERQSKGNKEIEANLGAENKADRAEAECENLPIEDHAFVYDIQIPEVVSMSENSSPDDLENKNGNGSEEQKCIPEGRTREIEIPIFEHERVEEQNGGLHEVSMEKSRDLKETTAVEPQEDGMPSTLETPNEDDSNAKSEVLLMEDIGSVSDIQLPGVVPTSEDSNIEEVCLTSTTEASMDKDNQDEDNGTPTNEISSDKKIEWPTATEQVTEPPSMMCVDATLTKETSYSDPVPVGNSEVREVTVDSQIRQEDLQAAEDIRCESKASSTAGSLKTDMNVGTKQSVKIIGAKNDSVDETPKEARIPALEDATTSETQVDLSNTESTDSPSESEKLPIQTLESVCDAQSPEVVANAEDPKVKETAEYTDENNVEDEHKTIDSELSSAESQEKEQTTDSKQVAEHPSIFSLDAVPIEENFEPHGEFSPISESVVKDQISETTPQPQKSDIGIEENELGRSSEHENFTSERRSVEDPPPDSAADGTISKDCAQETKEENIKQETMKSDEVNRSDENTESRALTKENLEPFGELKPASEPTSEEQSSETPTQPEKSGDASENNMKYKTLESKLEHSGDTNSIDVEMDLDEVVTLTPENQMNGTRDHSVNVNDVILTEEISHSDPIPVGNLEVTEVKTESQIGLEDLHAEEDLRCEPKASSTIEASESDLKEGIEQHVTITREVKNEGVNDPLEERCPVVEEAMTLEPQVNVSNIEFDDSTSRSEKSPIIAPYRDEGAVDEERETIINETENEGKSEERTHNKPVVGEPPMLCLDDEEVEISSGQNHAATKSDEDTNTEAKASAKEKSEERTHNEQVVEQASAVCLDNEEVGVSRGQNTAATNSDEDTNTEAKELAKEKSEETTHNEQVVEQPSMACLDNEEQVEISSGQNTTANKSDEETNIEANELTKENPEPYGELKPTSESLNEDQVNETPQPEQSDTSENNVECQTLESKLEHENEKELLIAQNQINSTHDHNETVKNVTLTEEIQVSEEDGCPTEVKKTSASNQKELASEMPAKSQIELENIQAAEERRWLSKASSTIGASKMEMNEGSVQTVTISGEAEDDHLDEAPNDEGIPALEDAKTLEPRVNLPETESIVSPSNVLDNMKLREGMTSSTQDEEKGEHVSLLTGREILLEGSIENKKEASNLEFEKKEKDHELISELETPDGILKMEVKEDRLEAATDTDKTLGGGVSSEKFLDELEDINTKEDIEVTDKGEEKAMEESYQDAEAGVTLCESLSQKEELSDKVEKADLIDIQEETMAKDNLHEEKTNIIEPAVKLHHKEKADETTHEGTSTDVTTPIEDVNSSDIEAHCDMDKTAEMYHAETEILKEDVHLGPKGDRSKITEEVSSRKGEPLNLPSTKERSMEFDAPVTHCTSATEGLEISQKYVTDDLTKASEVQQEIQKHEDSACAMSEQLPNKSDQSESTESKHLAKTIDASDKQGKTAPNYLKAEAEDLKAAKASGTKPLCSSKVFKEEKMSDEKENSETADPAKSLFTDILQESTKGTSQVAENLIEEKVLVQKKDQKVDKEEIGHNVVKTYEEKEEEDDEDNQNMGSYSDAPVMVEASPDMGLKVHKKSHNILSGVGSKVKHSIAKVKKAITGKSSHPKPPSPKEKDELTTCKTDQLVNYPKD